MNLILFDIDGTLTESQSIDSELYLRSLETACGLSGVDSDWSAYRHTTDSGILEELFQTRLGRAPTPAERTAFRSHFVTAVAHAVAHTPIREVLGARAMLRHLAAMPERHLALATGGWSDSARLKMRSAEMDFDAFPSASADDASARTEIMQVAIERAITRMGGRRPTRTVYVGDAIWDARACGALGIPFIGIASKSSDVEMLLAADACAVLADYSDLNVFCTTLASIGI